MKRITIVGIQWIEGSHRVLLALDAPLGWPAEMGRELARHLSGRAAAPSGARDVPAHDR